jgi:hypothetical protein
VICPRQSVGHALRAATSTKLHADLRTVALTKSGLPAVLVACKCENPEDDWEVDAGGMEKHDLFKSCIGTCRVSANKPELARACLQTILRAAVAHRRGMFAMVM